MSRRIFFVDVETTSLDARNPRTLLLEVGAVVTDQNLQVLGQLEAVVHHPLAELEACYWDPYAREMHEKNGLSLAVLENAGGAQTVEAVELQLLQLLAECGVSLDAYPRAGGSDHAEAPLWAGCSPKLDREILQRDMPRLYGQLHYRTIDLTSWREAYALCTGDGLPRDEDDKSDHRALADAFAAIDLAHHQWSFIRRGRKLMVGVGRIAQTAGELLQCSP